MLAVAVSQSGRTEEIVATQDWARSCGARTVAVTNDGDSPLASRADLALVTRAGEELAVPATKTFTTQLAALAVLGLALGGDRAGLDELRAVPEALSRALEAADAAEALAERLTFVQQLVVSARGYAYAVARELALKLEEACYVTALGLSYADLEHGPIAVVDADTPALLIAAERDDGDAERHDRAGAALPRGRRASTGSAATRSSPPPATPRCPRRRCRPGCRR